MEKYLMVVETYDGEYAEMVTPHEVIDHIDMQDCTDESIEVYRVNYGKTPEKLNVCGCWHDFDNPLYIKVTDAEGNIVFDGWGTDH